MREVARVSSARSFDVEHEEERREEEEGCEGEEKTEENGEGKVEGKGGEAGGDGPCSCATTRNVCQLPDAKSCTSVRASSRDCVIEVEAPLGSVAMRAIVRRSDCEGEASGERSSRQRALVKGYELARR